MHTRPVLIHHMSNSQLGELGAGSPFPEFCDVLINGRPVWIETSEVVNGRSRNEKQFLASHKSSLKGFRGDIIAVPYCDVEGGDSA